jgi:dUTP pyrophosphatase
MSICKHWIKVQKLYEDTEIPEYATEHAAGMDLKAHEDAVIPAGVRKLVGTGIAIEIPIGCFGGLYPRSGLAAKHGINLANCVGVIDADYRGEIKAAIQNNSSEDFVIKKGDRICQLIIQPYVKAVLVEAEALDETGRGAGGFGSTGGHKKLHSEK